jgi:flavorubredoxin
MAIDTTKLACAPYEVAKDTFVIPQLMEAPPVGLFCLNSMVIRAAEPVIVDTGTVLNRERWLDDVFSLVEPRDVRWIFLSHDDRDHSGNLMQVLEACPNATLVATWFEIGRLADEWLVPMPRVRFVRDGESFDAGDRTLTAIRPPLFDNPVTRGLFDSTTGVYWAVDTFATAVQEHMEDCAAIAREEWFDGMRLGARLVSPWHAWLDAARWGAHVDRVQSLPISAIASCHAPAIYGADIERAFEVLREAPSMEPWLEFGQDDLERWMQAAGV